MDWNMIIGILFFIIGTVLMPIGLKREGAQRFIFVGASILSDLIGILFLFYKG
jgi:hypothetical protein